MAESPKILQMRGAVAVGAPERDQMLFRFIAASPGEPDVYVAIPAGAVGNLLTQTAAQHQKMAMKASDNQAAMQPLVLTGYRPFWDGKGDPIMLLQFGGQFELAVSLTRSQADQVQSAAQELVEGPSAPLPKRQ